MKILGNFKEWTVTQTKLAEILGVSVQRVNQLIEEEVVIRAEMDNVGAVLLIDSLRNYYLSRKVTGDGANYWKEKALREQINRKRDALKLQQEDGSVYTAVAVEAAFIEMLTVLRTNLLGLPSKFAVQLENKSRAEIYEIITEEIESNLAELSNYDPAATGEVEELIHN